VAVPLAGVSGALVLEGRSLFLDITGTDRCSTAAVLAMVCTAKQ
jgi:phenylalanyl-tRNA synthetase beta subunit